MRANICRVESLPVLHWFAGFNFTSALGCSNPNDNRSACPTSRELIEQGPFTHVILQDYSVDPDTAAQPDFGASKGGMLESPYIDPDPAVQAELSGWCSLAIAATYSGRMIEEVKRAGKIPVIWSIWPRQKLKGDPGKWDKLIQGYKKIAEDNAAVFAPVSGAWKLVLDARPTYQLYKDDVHPTGAAGILNAYVIYAAITRRSPVGIDYPATSAELSVDDRRFLQEKAWEALQTF